MYDCLCLPREIYRYFTEICQRLPCVMLCLLHQGRSVANLKRMAAGIPDERAHRIWLNSFTPMLKKRWKYTDMIRW